MCGVAYENGKFDGVQACIDFIKSLPEEEMNFVPSRALVGMIRAHFENWIKDRNIEVNNDED